MYGQAGRLESLDFVTFIMEVEEKIKGEFGIELTIADENLLRSKGMLIGVFELLADSRDQVSTVMAAINAEQQFWLADANLQASLVGRPTGLSIASPAAAQSGGAEGH